MADSRTVSAETRGITRMMTGFMNSYRDLHDRQHERATHMLPIDVKYGRERLLITKRYTDAAANEHMTLISKYVRNVFTRRWRVDGEIIFSTSDWVRFMRSLSPSFVEINSFSFPLPLKEHGWHYKVVVQNNNVTLSQQYISLSTNQTVQRINRGNKRSISVSSHLWEKVRKAVRHGCRVVSND